jgi:hypothetical protein
MIPFFTFKFDKVYQLRFGMGSSVRYQQMTGRSVFEIEQYDLDTCIEILWVLLSEQRPELKKEDIPALIDEYADSVASIVKQVAEMCNAAYPVVDPKNVKTTAKKS